MTTQDTLSLESASRLLQHYGLLREMIQYRHNNATQSASDADTTHVRNEIWSLNASDFETVKANEAFEHITYDTRDIKPGTLLFVKGNFKAEYLDGADEKGLIAYVSEQSYAQNTHAVGIIVNDVRKAMSVLSAAYYRSPQEHLSIVGITGTKGKTTTAYFTHAILNAHSHGKAALFSSVDNCLDGKHYTESNLTTPESLDAFRMMREAVDNGMQYLVMEVSSQAYKVDRVFGLKFDVGAFLNISPDHISSIEHPTFEDYLYCKRQLIANSKCLVLNADTDHADLLMQDAEQHHTKVTTVARFKDEEEADNTNSDNSNNSNTICEEKITNTLDNYPKLMLPDYAAIPVDSHSETYYIAKLASESNSDNDNCENENNCENALEEAHYNPIDTFTLSIAGSFNYENATAAIAIANELGIGDDVQALHAIETITISGRMEVFNDTHSNMVAVVDYAHNYISTKSVIDFVQERYGNENPRITLITGSTGDKAVDRRKEIVDAAQNRIDEFIFTAEDTNTESVSDICTIMQGYVTNPHVASQIILDRTQAIETAYAEAQKSTQEEKRRNILLVIGKGDERWIKLHNKHIPYEGDSFVVKRLFGIQ